jgi:hypothetical protein
MKYGNECSNENVLERFVCATAGNLPICGTVVQGRVQYTRPRRWENADLGHVTVDYKVSERDIKWFLITSVKLAMFVKKM